MKQCKFCKQLFSPHKKRKLFCSAKCSSTFTILNVRDRRKKRGKHIKCINCSKEFYVPQYRIKTAKYCSRSCLAKIHLSQFEKFRFQKTGKIPHTYKYITTPKGKRIREHRFIMEQYLGRKLSSNEHVHHINGNSYDNCIENLIILSNSDHQKKEHIYRKKLFLIKHLLHILSSRLLSF